MTFAASLWLWALALIPLLAGLFLWHEKRRGELLRQLVAARLSARLAGSASRVKRLVRAALLLLGLAGLIIAMAQPQRGYTWQESKRKGRDVIIAIDTSRSMLAPDLAPNRLTRAKLAAQDLIEQLQGDRVGLVAFAGGAFLQAPLTVDYSAVLASVQELDTEIIPRGGTNISQAIKIAADAFTKGESANQALIIFTDGEELEADAVDAASQHAETLRVFTVGVGSAEGSVIPVPGQQGGTEFVRNAAGEVVKSRLDDNRLVEIAQAGGGFFMRLANGPADMRRIMSEGLGTMEERDIDARTTRTPIERYQWPLGLGLFAISAALLLGERRRGAVLAALLLAPAGAQASAEGVRLYQQEDYKGARSAFEQRLERRPNSRALHFDVGTAAYKLGDYDAALKAFGEALSTDDKQLRASAEYNLGNTLFQRGAKVEGKEPKLKEWNSAIEHYEQALNIDPENADAKYNRDVIRKLIDELNKEQEEEKQDQKEDEQKKDDKQDQKEKQDKKDQQDSKESDGGKENQGEQEKKPGGEKQDEKKEGEGEKPEDGEGSKGEDEEEKKPGEGEQPGQQDQQNGGEQKKDSGKPDQPLEQPDRDLSGDIGSQDQPAPSPAEAEQAAEAEAAQAAERGEMTEGQARALMESLKGEDERVLLHDRKQSSPVVNDW